jgi:redox-sensitive bicupin YhaK (pirin superfamily)
MRIANLQCSEAGESIAIPHAQSWSGVLYVLSGSIQVSDAPGLGKANDCARGQPTPFH